ncbi:MAG: MMPL family transporter, partial [Deltaproteobacteria bacterium]|nr:MMPL family transporter [Deltaproteobacteria bacterium]
MDKYRGSGTLFLGGVEMILDDLIEFIRSDLKLFGLGILCFLILTLGIIFRRLRWILLPLLCCAVSAVAMVGLLGLAGWEVTVISANFISLQLIITMAVAIHLVVRYRELHRQAPDTPQRTLVLETVRLKLIPCLYAALTTIAGFGSLLFCDILPVINFGWMMTAGIIVSLIVTFLLFPAVLVKMKPYPPRVHKNKHSNFLPALARFTENRGALILIISGLGLIAAIAGITQLEVENAFINYFKASTEIHQGMRIIDQKLGGTTPLEVILDLEENSVTESPDSPAVSPDSRDEFDAFDEFDTVDDRERYWFTMKKIALVKTIHDYLEQLPETGKIISLGTVAAIGEALNAGRPLDNFQFALLYKEMPDKYKQMLITPYASPAHNQLRFSVRVRDSEKTLQRNELLKKIRRDLTGRFGLDPEQVHLTGALVLYNNMLRSLFDSQILTFGIVLAALMGMFLVLFRSVTIALIAITPNLLSVVIVLGIMGWFNIPLDMMTITIAAVSVGIAVDNTIHYLHRFQEEIDRGYGYTDALHRCHDTIGHAMYYTSLTIMTGFSILVLSNFIPSITFGLLTGLAMLIALFTALTLLPQLLIVFKPYGREQEAGG